MANAVRVDLLEEARRPFVEVAVDLADALIYLDAGAGEAAHFTLGLRFFFGLGAARVCSLECASADDAALVDASSSGLKIVVFITRCLNELHGEILRVVSSHPKASVTIFCTVSEELASMGREEEEEEGEEHEEEAQGATDGEEEGWGDAWGGQGEEKEWESWSKRGGPAEEAPSSGTPLGRSSMRDIAVRGFPSLFCAMSPDLFLLPAESCFSPMSGGSPFPPGGEGAAKLDREGAAALPAPALMLAHGLASLGAQLNVKWDLYGMGATSRTLARTLAASPALDTSGPGSMKAALVLVDRTLDLHTPSLHTDGLLDRIYAVLQRRAPCHSQPGAPRPADVRVPLHTLYPLAEDCACSSEATPGKPLLGGSVLHPGDQRASQLLEALLVNKLPETELGCARRTEGAEPKGDAEDDESGDPGYEAHQLRLQVQGRVEELFRRLEDVAGARQNLKEFRLLDASASGGEDGGGAVPLLTQVLSKIVQRADISDMVHATGSLGGFLKTGLGRFGLQTLSAAERLMTLTAANGTGGGGAEDVACQLTDLLHRAVAEEGTPAAGAENIARISIQEVLTLMVGAYSQLGPNTEDPDEGPGIPHKAEQGLKGSLSLRKWLLEALRGEGIDPPVKLAPALSVRALRLLVCGDESVRALRLLVCGDESVRALPLLVCGDESVRALRFLVCGDESVRALPLLVCGDESVRALRLLVCGGESVRALPLLVCGGESVRALPFRCSEAADVSLPVGSGVAELRALLAALTKSERPGAATHTLDFSGGAIKHAALIEMALAILHVMGEPVASHWEVGGISLGEIRELKENSTAATIARVRAE
eukprot:gene546-938_t